MPGWLMNRPGFSGGEVLTYRLRSVATPGPPRTAFHEAIGGEMAIRRSLAPTSAQA